MKKKRKPSFIWRAGVALCSLALLFCVAHAFILPKIQQTRTAGTQAEAVQLYSRCAILMDVQSGEILLEKNSEKRAYPASLTKIMTALIAIEKNSDLNKSVVLDSGIFERLQRENASLAGFAPGEQVRLIDLIYGTLLPSGAEAAVSLAEQTAGSQKEFLKLMNQKGRELKLKGTRYSNVTGLHAKDQITTAADIARLLRYALQNPTFREVFLSQSYTVPPTNRHSDGFTMHSTLFSRMGDASLEKGEILGGKTGFTDQAGLCLASLAKYQDRELILVTLDADGNLDTPQYNILDALSVYRNYLK